MEVINKNVNNFVFLILYFLLYKVIIFNKILKKRTRISNKIKSQLHQNNSTSKLILLNNINEIYIHEENVKWAILKFKQKNVYRSEYYFQTITTKQYHIFFIPG